MWSERQEGLFSCIGRVIFIKKGGIILQSVGFCVICPKEMGCLGSHCSMREGAVLRCVRCGREIAQARFEEGKGLCPLCERVIRMEEYYVVGREI